MRQDPHRGVRQARPSRGHRRLPDDGSRAAHRRTAAVLGSRSGGRQRPDGQRRARVRVAALHGGRHVHRALDEPPAPPGRAGADPTAPGALPPGRLRGPDPRRPPRPRPRRGQGRPGRGGDAPEPHRVVRAHPAALDRDARLRLHGRGRRRAAARRLAGHPARVRRRVRHRPDPAVHDPAALAGVLPTGGRRPVRDAARRRGRRTRPAPLAQPGDHREHRAAACRSELPRRDPGRAHRLPAHRRRAHPRGGDRDRGGGGRRERRSDAGAGARRRARHADAGSGHVRGHADRGRRRRLSPPPRTRSPVTRRGARCSRSR